MRLSVNQVKKEINENILIIAIGQRPNIKNKIDIECQAKLNESIIVNTIDMTKIKKIIQPNYDVDISNNAGTSYCNNLYYHILKYCSKSNNRIIFLHIPYIQNISEFNKLVVTLEELIDNIDNAI